MKKFISIFLISACLLSLACLFGFIGVKWMFDAQYNTNGISHFLVITIDENQPKQYIGKLDTHTVFIEKLNIDETYFTSVNAENISIKEAIDKNLASIDDWKKYARKTERNGDTEILRYENYEIVVTPNECVIRPLTK